MYRFKSHDQEVRLTIVAEMPAHLDQFVVVSSGNHAHDIAAIKIASDDDVAIEWAIQNSRLFRKSAARKRKRERKRRRQHLGQEDECISHRGNETRKQSRITSATIAYRTMLEACLSTQLRAHPTPMYNDSESVVDALKVSLGSEHTVFRCMYEAYIAGTQDAYAKVRVKIWIFRSSHITNLNRVIQRFGT